MGDDEHNDLERFAVGSVDDLLPERQARMPARRLPKVQQRPQIPREIYLAFLDDPRTVAAISKIAKTKSTKPKAPRTDASPENYSARTKRVDSSQGEETFSILNAAKILGTSYSKAHRLLTESGAVFQEIPNATGRMSKRVTMDEIEKVLDENPQLRDTRKIEAPKAAGGVIAGGTASISDVRLEPNVPNGLALTRSAPRQLGIPSNAKFAGL